MYLHMYDCMCIQLCELTYYILSKCIKQFNGKYRNAERTV